MALTADGRIAGSVSGGCVESAVVEAGAEVLGSGKARLLHFGVSNDTAWSVGLACGGSIDVFVEPLSTGVFNPLRDALRAERAAATATLIRGAEGRIGAKLAVFDDGTTAGAIDDAALAAARAALGGGPAGRIAIGDSEFFLDVLLPSPRLIVVGGVHIAIPLVTFGKALGFRAILVDPRESFGNAKRFPHADEIVSEWPDRALEALAPNASTAIAILTHDPKLDDPALRRGPAQPGLLRRRPRQPAHPREAARAPAGRRNDRSGAFAPPCSHRPRPRRAIARGDRPLRRRPDRRRPQRALTASANRGGSARRAGARAAADGGDSGSRRRGPWPRRIATTASFSCRLQRPRPGTRSSTSASSRNATASAAVSRSGRRPSTRATRFSDAARSFAASPPNSRAMRAVHGEAEIADVEAVPLAPRRPRDLVEEVVRHEPAQRGRRRAV